MNTNKDDIMVKCYILYNSDIRGFLNIIIPNIVINPINMTQTFTEISALEPFENEIKPKIVKINI